MAESDPIYINIQNYKLNFDEIGRGAFGNVYQGVNTDTNEVVAAKKVKYKDGRQPINEVLSEMGQKEGEILHRLNGHRNIVKLLNFFDDNKSSYWFIMEFCGLGDLSNYMKNQAIDLNAKVRIMVDVASGLAFMHGMTPPVIHRDVKVENILMKQEGEHHIAKISDFGMGKLFEADTNHFTMTSGVGTMGYMAPELFADGEYLRYQPGVDTFSLGLLFSVVLLYDKKHNDMQPMSAQTRKCGAYIHYGLEMKIADQNKAPMPQLFDQGEKRYPCVAQIREIISAMTQFHDKDRPSLQQVKMQILESYYDLIQFENIAAEFSKLKTKYHHLKTGHESLQRSSNALQSEHSELRRGCATLQSNNDQLQSYCNRLKSDKDKLQSDCNTLQSDKNELQSDCNTLQSDKDELQSDCNTLQSDKDELESYCDTLQSDKDELQSDCNTLQSDKDELQSDCNTLQSDKDELESYCDTLQSDKDELQSYCNSFESERYNLQSYCGALQSDIHELQIDCHSLQSHKDALQSDCDTLQSDNDTLHRNYNEVQREQVKLKQTLGIFQTEHGKLLREHSKFETDRGTLQTSLGNLRIKHGAVQEEYGKLQLDFGNLQEKSGKLETEHGQIKTEHGQIKTEHGQLKTKHCQLKTEYGQLKTEHGQLQTEHGQLKTEHGQLKTEHGQLKTEHDQLKTEHGQLKTEHGQFKTEHGRLKTEHGHLKTEHGQLKTEDGQLKTEHGQLQTAHGQLQTAHGQLKTEHGLLQTAHGQLQTAHGQLKTEHGLLQTAHGQLQTEHGQLQTAHGQLQTAYGQLKTEDGQLKTENGQLKTAHGQLQTEHGQLKTEHGKLQTEHGQVQREYGQIEKEMGNSQIENGRVLHQNGLLLSEIGEIKSRLATEMSEEMSNNQSSIENVSIKHRPVRMADEYQEFRTNEWLDLKQFLDESFPKDSEKKKLSCLTDILMHSYETTVAKYQQITADLNVRLIHPMASADSDGQHRKPPKQEKAVKASDHLTNSIGDHTKIWADEIDIKQLANEICSTMNFIGEYVLKSQQLQQYISSCARFCWRMLLHTPPMAFDVTGINKRFKQDLQEAVWGSTDPKDPCSAVAVYAHPALYHGHKLMVKGKVLLELRK